MSDEQKNEDRWFSENEEQFIREAKERREKEMQEKANQQSEELKKLHWMKCPKCGSDMKVINLESIEVDKCTVCEGVFFDAGELDELLLIENDKKKSAFRKLFF